VVRSVTSRFRTTSRVAEAAWVLLGGVVVAIAATYPLIGRMADHLPSDVSDPVLNAWILGWDAARLRSGIERLWDAPNFFPYPHTLTYSDHLLGIAVFSAPIQWLSGNPVLTYNIAFLGSWVLSAAGMYVLARSLTGRVDAALVAAAAYTFAPFRIAHLSHLQWLTIGWLPLSLWALHRYFATGAWKFALAAAACFLLQGLTVGYFMYFGLLPLAFVAVAELRRTHVAARRLVVQAATVGVLLIAAVAPVARAYYANRQQLGMRRSMDDIRDHSADLRDFASAARLPIAARVLPDGGSEHSLFPGLTTTALVLVAVVACRRRWPVMIYVAITLAAFVLSFGPAPAAWGHVLPYPGPYRVLLAVVPGLDALRAPARLAAVLILASALLAAFGSVWVLDRAGAARRTVVTVALLTAIVAEGWMAPMPVAAFDPAGDPRDRAAYHYLRGLPPGGVLELPLGVPEREFRYQYLTLIHEHPVVNGHSGYIAPLVRFLEGGHSPFGEANHLDAALEMAGGIGVRYVVVHRDEFKDGAGFDAIVDAARSHPERVTALHDFNGIVVLTLRGEPPPRRPDARPVPASALRVTASAETDRVPLMLDGDPRSRWLTGRPQNGTEWIDVQLDRVRDVAIISMTMAERSFGDYPRGLAVDVTDDSGTRTVYEGFVTAQFAQGLIAHPKYPSIEIVIPSNRARSVRLRQTGTTRSFFWSLHELQLLER
jgi:hypothetical protein